MDFDVPKRLIAALEAERVSYAVFGAVAMNLHGMGRRMRPRSFAPGLRRYASIEEMDRAQQAVEAVD